MKTKNPLISVVIVAGLKRLRELIRCLRSIKRSTYKNYEVIVVNNSSSSLLAKVKTEFPQIRGYQMPENTGIFGYNVGFANSQGEYILALDDDSTIKPDTLGKISEIFSRKPSTVVVISPNFYNPIYKYSYCKKYLDSKPKKIYAFLGGGVVFRKSIFPKIGYYDPDFFCWYHELDLAVRVLNGGFEIHFEPEIVVFHHGKKGVFRKKETFLSYRNQFWFNIKHFSLIFIPILIARDIFFIFYLPFKTRSLKKFFYALEGYLFGFLTFFIPLRKRKVVSFAVQKEFLKFYLTNR